MDNDMRWRPATYTEAASSLAEGGDWLLVMYEKEKAAWLRALVLWIPGAGPVDMLLAWRGTHLNQQRVAD